MEGKGRQMQSEERHLIENAKNALAIMVGALNRDDVEEYQTGLSQLTAATLALVDLEAGND